MRGLDELPSKWRHRFDVAALTFGIDSLKLGTAADIANAVVFFASDLAGFVNGQILQVDGGR